MAWKELLWDKGWDMVGDFMGGGDNGSSMPTITYNMPSYGQWDMTLETPSKAGTAETIEAANYRLFQENWKSNSNGRLWGQDSYTGISLPGVNT